MKIPSLDKGFPLQHRDHGFALAIQWFFIESAENRYNLPKCVPVSFTSRRFLWNFVLEPCVIAYTIGKLGLCLSSEVIAKIAEISAGF